MTQDPGAARRLRLLFFRQRDDLVLLVRDEVGTADLAVDALNVALPQDAEQLLMREIQLLPAIRREHQLHALHAHVVRHGAHRA